MVSIIAIDLAKNVFQVIGLNKHQKPVFEHRFRRAKLESFMRNQPKTVVAMEACYMAHYWGRRFQAMGHAVKLLPAQHVKPFVRGNKHDSNDALAIAEAAHRPHLRAVPVKTVEQQQLMALHRIRERLKRQRIQLTNQARGLLAEFGLVFPQGHKAFRLALLDTIDKQLPSPQFAPVLQQLYDEYLQCSERLVFIDREIQRSLEHSPHAEVLMSIPGIGPTIASAVIGSIDRGQAFATPREFAVWLGLTPRLHASGESHRLGGITKRGDRYLRTLYVAGANAVLRWTKHRHDAFSRWANAIVARRGRHKGVVAIAHKLARLSWILLQRQTMFVPQAI